MWILPLILLSESLSVQPVEIDSSILDGFEEWVAPGYRIAEAIVIDPREYGDEPIAISERIPDAWEIACLGFFVPTPEGEKWRVAMVFADKVVVVQEDSDPREIPLTIDAQGAFFSKGGRYVLVHEWNTDSLCELINLDDGISLPFDYSFSYEGGMPRTWVGDDGSVVTLGNPGGLELVFFVGNELQSFVEAEHSFAGISQAQDGSLVFCIDYPPRTEPCLMGVAYDRQGTRLWSRDVSWEMMFASDGAAVAPDGGYVINSAQDGIECYDGETGELRWRIFAGVSFPTARLSSSGRIASTSNINCTPLLVPDSNILVSIGKLLVLPEWSSFSFAVSEDGSHLRFLSGLNRMIPRAHRRYVLQSADDTVLYISERFSTNVGRLDVGFRNNNSESNMCAGTAALSSDGRSILFDNMDVIRLVRVEEVQD